MTAMHGMGWLMLVSTVLIGLGPLLATLTAGRFL